MAFKVCVRWGGGRITQVEADRYLMRLPGRVCAQTPDRSMTNMREIPIHLTWAGLTHALALTSGASPWLRHGAALRRTAKTPQEATVFPLRIESRGDEFHSALREGGRITGV